MDNYTIRRATLDDTGFLTEAIIVAAKGNSGKLGFSTLFDLPEDRVRHILKAMLEEEVDECEFSISSFLIAEHKGQPVAAVGGWVEGLTQKIKSAILKSNLMNFNFPGENIKVLLSRMDIISDVLIDRENLSLQIEYVYVDEAHRGKGLGEGLIKEHIKNGLIAFPGLGKVQIQLFSNNVPAIRLYERIGFQIASKFRSSNENVLEYLPHNETLLMEINIK